LRRKGEVEGVLDEMEWGLVQRAGGGECCVVMKIYCEVEWNAKALWA